MVKIIELPESLRNEVYPAEPWFSECEYLKPTPEQRKILLVSIPEKPVVPKTRKLDLGTPI